MSNEERSSSNQDVSLAEPILFVAALMGLKDLFVLFVPTSFASVMDPATTAVVGVLIVVGVLYIFRFRQRGRLEGLHVFPTEPKLFNPFKMNAMQPNIWPRTGEVERLAQQLRDCAHRHLVVVGQSGAGKSTLVREMLIPLISKDYDNGKDILPFDTYGAFALDLVKRFPGNSEALLLQGKLATEYKKVTEGSLSVREAFDPLFENERAKKLADSICAYLSRAIGEKPFVFVFDQIERYLQLLASDTKRHSTAISGFDAYFFIRIIQCLRLMPHVRTVFVIRAETFYNVFEFLILVAARDTKNDAGSVSTFICPGINAQSTPEAIKGIRDDFKKIAGADAYLQEFEFMTGLYNRELSNTFMIQLIGFVTEHFFDSDPRVKDMLKGKKDRVVAIRLLFDILFEDFSRVSLRPDSLDLLKAILFSIAIENRTTGQAVSQERIAALTHIPPPTVEAGVKFFQGRGILRRETGGGEPCFRVGHDVIGDYVIESEQFAIDPNLRDGIRSLSESRVATSEMTKIDRYSSLTSDLSGHWDVGLVFIWLFIVFGAAKILISPFCELSYKVLSRYAPQALTCAVVNRSYATTYIMHVIWLSFIYSINKNYFSHVFRSKAMRLGGELMGTVGALMAVWLSQSPALLLLPVVAGGMMMGSLLVIGSFNGTFVQREAYINRDWGKLTLLNMCFTASLTMPALLVLWSDEIATRFWNEAGASLSGILNGVIFMQNDAIATIWLIFMNGLMIYFWYHIRPVQQGRISFASRLSSHDRSQTEIASL